MISLAMGQSRMSIAAIIFFTCIWIPLRQLKKTVGNFIRIISGRRYDDPLILEVAPPPPPQCQAKLAVCRFGELEEKDEEEVCSICLVEFVGEDPVSQLPGCRHLFHCECIENWLHRYHYTCPLCRSFFFNAF